MAPNLKALYLQCFQLTIEQANIEFVHTDAHKMYLLLLTLSMDIFL
jgi:hypothetical protein